MALISSNNLALNSEVAHFILPDVVSEEMIDLDKIKSAKATVIIFMCNHCPYVKHILERLTALAAEYQKKGVQFIAINSNDVVKYPNDSPEKMRELAKQLGFTFPYLFDETQEVAKAYQAACTPDIYVADANLSLVYHGQFDDSRPKNQIAVTGEDLRKALDSLLNGQAVDQQQKPGIGCSIKWLHE